MMTQEQERKEQIRDAAYRCFRESGYHKTTVDMICKDANCSKGSFYWHYNSKQSVFLDILHNWAQEVISELLKQFENVMNQPNAIHLLTYALQKELHRGRTVVPLWLEFTSQAQRDEKIQTAIAKFYRRTRAAIVEILGPLTSHALTEEELQGVSTTIFGAYMGLVIQEMADPEGVHAQTAIAQVMPVIEKYLSRNR